MMRMLSCVLGAAWLTLSAPASAQEFAKKGDLALGAERLFGFSYSSATLAAPGGDQSVQTTSISLLSAPAGVFAGGTAWQGYGSPRIAADYFVIDRLSLGAALGYAHWSESRPATLANLDNSVSGDTFTFAPRVGYAFSFTELIGIWPRGGFTYRTFSSGDASAHDLALTLEAPITFSIWPHVVVWGGPTLDLGLSGSSSVEIGNGTTTSRDFNATEFGLQTALLVEFGT